MRSLRNSMTLAGLSAIALTVPCRAQCSQWDARFSPSGTDGAVQAAAVFDDGSGDSLFIGGSFDSAGDVRSRGIAKWNGASISSLDAGVSGAAASIFALAVFDDGSGTALYAGGSFTAAGTTSTGNIAKWNGTSWSSLASGVDGVVRALAVHDDGNGTALYAGGSFVTAGGTSASRIAKWDGASWSAVGTGVNADVYALCVFDEGIGAALYAGGDFTTAGGSPASRIARWMGASWTPLAAGTNGRVRALAVFDDGAGPELYAGGDFTTAGPAAANRIARWNGSTGWAAVGTGVSGPDVTVRSLFVFDDGTGEALCVGGRFTNAGGTAANRVAKWQGSTWSALGAGTDALVQAFAAYDDGSGTKLYTGGEFARAGSVGASRLARWDGSNWSRPVAGKGAHRDIAAFATYDDGSGPALYAGGSFAFAGDAVSRGIARWNGDDWTATGSGIALAPGDNAQPSILALAVFDDGSGPELYASGSFLSIDGVSANGLARWNGSSWMPVPIATGSVLAFAVVDDVAGPVLVAGGEFRLVGSSTVHRIAKWDGTAWSTLPTEPNAIVRALIVFDDGLGPALFAGGDFQFAGGIAVHRIAKWDGSFWTPLANGLSARVQSLAVHDAGSGPALYVGGQFTSTQGGATSLQHVARWQASSWSALGSGLNIAEPNNVDVNGMAVMDDGSGAALFVGGRFNTAGGASAKNIAKWNGAAWSSLSTGLTGGEVWALNAFDHDADGNFDLYAGGTFATAGDVPSVGVAEWLGCEAGTAYCFGDGIDSVVTAQCPCANYGAAGHGCANSSAPLGGARLWASGSTSPNTLVFHCEGIPNNALGTFMRATTNTAAGFVMGDGVRCATGTIIRFGQQNAGQNGNPPNTIAVGPTTVAPGLTRYYQVQYRNPNFGFCPPELFNFSNGYVVSW